MTQRRQARPKTTAVAGTCKHEIIILVASVSAHLVNARVVKHFFLQCSSLERASRSFARTVFFIFYAFFDFFFLCAFSLVVLRPGRVFWESFARPLGVIFVTFGK